MCIRDSAGGLDLRLKTANVPEIVAKRHETGVGLGAEDCGDDDLQSRLRRVVNRYTNRVGVDAGTGMTEEVHDVDAARRTDGRCAHGPMLRVTTWREPARNARTAGHRPAVRTTTEATI